MKIGIPGSNNSNNKNQNKRKKFNKKPIKFDPSKVKWVTDNGIVRAIIKRNEVKIDLETLEIVLPNGFKIGNSKDLSEAKEKVVDFFTD